MYAIVPDTRIHRYANLYQVEVRTIKNIRQSKWIKNDGEIFLIGGWGGRLSRKSHLQST